jgi:hypothetical protein
MRPTNKTLGQGLFPGPRYASRLGKSPTRPMANATRETPNKSERASLKVVSSAPAATITGPIPLPRANKVAASGEDDCASLVAPSTAIAVPTTKRYRSVAEPRASTVALGITSWIAYFLNQSSYSAIASIGEKD